MDRIGTVWYHGFEIMSEPAIHGDSTTRSPTHYVIWGVVERDEDGQLFAYSPSLAGPSGTGQTPEEALRDLKVSVAACIESYFAAGEEIPWEEGSRFDAEAVLTRWLDVEV